MNLREAAQQALEALEALQGGCTDHDDGTVEAITVWCPEIITALRAALAEPQEPVAYIHRQGNHWEVSERFLLDDEKARGWTEEPLYTAPPQRKPLTDEEIRQAADQRGIVIVGEAMIAFARAIERAHKIF